MLGNWISETTATTGTGTISLGWAATADVMAFSAQFASGLWQNLGISGAWPSSISQTGWTLQYSAAPTFGFLP